MIRTKEAVLYDTVNQHKEVIYADIIRLEIDRVSRVNIITIEEFVIVDGEKKMLLFGGSPSRTYEVTFKEENNLRKMIKGTTKLGGRNKTLFVLTQGHLYQNNLQNVYGSQREEFSDDLPLEDDINEEDEISLDMTQPNS